MKSPTPIQRLDALCRHGVRLHLEASAALISFQQKQGRKASHLTPPARPALLIHNLCG
ncbi:hypothetical protein HMPREF9080_02889 [Cardiobacterium valvarum F0432]|uniref:Uncharacterized protein n=1 Tax=Cardiobacterium valvarum F0432 TaxID=797473 RepID=G9ZJB9_9GAMM|nr:hypothetical protein HMPREF9080_02889 [Cardiobacterium valvarum F0432]